MSQSIVRLNAKQIERAELLLRNIPGWANKVMARVLNRSTQTARASMVSEVREEYTAKAKAIRNTISIKKASSSRPEAVVESVGSPLPLRDFKVNPRTQNGRRRTPIRVSVKKGNSHSFGSAFVLRTGGSINVFERVGKRRLPIRKMFGPSVPQMIGNESVINRIAVRTESTAEKRLDHEIDRLLSGG
ncbi:hypothetical protein PVP_XSN000012 [Vibrio phage PVP-XSN]|uniref:Minor tail protein Z n=1 Tax=Vibrio phage PVP-XSN TaxID=3056214 RepID=A0AAX3Y6G2_9CAUD|nr:hypothetical protein PVP_XSN000043 [Vibrio phage PVP-XSN]